jgi:hypothetical protein
MGATFAATESIVANQREKQDALNGVAGGCAAGFLAGIRGACRRAFSMPFSTRPRHSSFPPHCCRFLRRHRNSSGNV